MTDTNAFGGLNPRSLYVPMSDIEQEVISRLVGSKDLQVVLVGWGHVDSPRVTFGDARLGISFRVNFSKPEAPQPLHYLDMELRTGSGILLFKQRQSTLYAGNPVQVCAGMFIDMVWDIAVQSIDPVLVKTLIPAAIGLTSRLQDKDTGEITLQGNMRLNSSERNILNKLRTGEASAREHTIKRAKYATGKAAGK